MKKLSSKEIQDYLYQSYAKVDGLWFVKVEEKFGFDKSLEIDREVWEVMPKIQARLLKSKLGLGDGIDALFECLKIKLKLDNFKFKAKKIGGSESKNSSIIITINHCPWHYLLVKSNRDKISGKIGSMICETEYSKFSQEFGKNIHLELKDRICKGSECCRFVYTIVYYL